ncbi:MAG: transport system ATP-binding/permease protein [Chloroflexota bacterium]|nr:transport system ATP-binding/permease protein [Chloroflexota bacterium]
MRGLRIRAGGDEVLVESTEAVIIGRGPEARVRCSDSRVSRRHLVVRPENGDWRVEDPGSSNGTFMDGDRVASFLLVEAVSLRLGDPASGVLVELEPDRGDETMLVDAALTRLDGGATRLYETPPAAGPEPVRTGTVRIGRSADNDVVLEDLQVSRYHAELVRVATGGWELVDLGSHNGTFVNGARITRSRLADDDLVSFADRLLRFAGGALQEHVEEDRTGFEAVGLVVRGDAGTVLLDEVSFSLDRCSFLAVVGTSGAGKSTLLNALAGFRPAQEGSVLCGGRDLYSSYDEMRQRIGYVPQDDILHPQLTVRRALRYAAELRFPPDVSTADREARVEEVMAELGLSARADLVISKLSGGQRKRTSIAVELLTKPELLFLDEPTSGLDPGYEKALMGLLRQLADGGRTVIVVTHSLQSLSLCDRALVLAPGGRTAFFGPPDEALEHFGRTDFADVFSDLEAGRDLDWKTGFLRSSAYARYVRRRQGLPHRVVAQPAAPAPPPGHRWLRQFWTLTRRYVAVIASDRSNLALLGLQAPILAVVILLANGPGGFDPDTAVAIRIAQSLGLFLAVSACYLGAGNAIREIVKELPVYLRERAVGLSISAYVASKVAVLSVITVLQAVALVLVGTARQGRPPDAALLGSWRLEMCVGIALCGLASMGLALMLSAMVRNGDKAVTLLPLILVPQLVLCSPQLQIYDKPVLGQIADVASAQWGYAIFASTVDTNQLVADAQAGPGPSQFDTRGRWNHDAHTWLTDAGWLAGLLAVELVATGLLLRRRDPSLLG